MNILFDYWYIYIAIIVLLTISGSLIFAFFKSPPDSQLRKVREWLLYAVTQAEIQLGSGTGRLKLRFVYDLFVTKFKWIAYLISFESFSDLVDEALDEMRDMLSTNAAVQSLVNKEVDLHD